MKKQRKSFSLILLMTIIVINTASFSAYAEPDIKVKLNGAVLAFDVPPKLIDDRTMVPMRVIFEALGAEVIWDGETQMVQGMKDGIVIQLQIGSTLMFKNGNEILLDVPPQIVDDRL